MKRKQKFGIVEGAHLLEKEAQVYGEFLYRLSKEKAGTLTAGEVLKAARPDDSPIHDCFIWDDSRAAEKYRLEQARYLLRSIEVLVLSDDGERNVRAFFKCEMPEGSDEERSIYVTAEVVAHDAYFHSQILKRALQEIKAWQGRYRDYSELRQIFGAIEQTQRKLFRHDEKSAEIHA